MATATVDTEIIIRTEKLMAELRKVPGIAEAEAKKMTAAVSREWAKAEKEAEKASKKMAAEMRQAFEEANREVERSAEEASAAVATAAAKASRAAQKAHEDSARFGEKALKQLGGSAGNDLADIIELATDAGGAVGGIGVAAVAAVGGVALLAGGIYEISEAALAARDRLQEAGRESLLPDEAVARLDDYEDSTSALWLEVDRLTVQIGGELVPTLSLLADTTAEVIRWWDDLRQGAEDLPVPLERAAKGFSALGDLAQGIGSLGLTYWISRSQATREEQRKLIEEWERTGAAAEEEYQRIYDLAQQAKDGSSTFVGPVLEDSDLLATRDAAAREKEAEATKKAAEARRAAAEAAREQAKAEQELRAALQATEQVEALILSTTADRIGAEEEIERAYQARLDAIERAAAAGADAAATQKATTEAELRRQRDLADLAHGRQVAAEAEAKAAEELAADLAALRAQVDEVAASWDPVSVAVQIYAAQLDELLSHPAMQAIGDIFGQWADLFTDGNEQIIADMEARHDRQLEQFERERDARREQLDEWLAGEQERIDAQLAAGAISEAEAKAERKRLLTEAREREKAAAAETKAAKAALNERHKHQLKLAREAFKANQALQRVQAIMEAGRAAISMIPGFAFLGPGAPIAAATAAATALGIQLSAINAQEMPEFPMGRSPDHTVPVGLAREDEAVVPGQRVAQFPGGARGMERFIERGELPGGSPEIHLHVDGRLVASSRVDASGFGAFDAPSWAAGRRPLYGV